MAMYLSASRLWPTGQLRQVKVSLRTYSWLPLPFPSESRCNLVLEGHKQNLMSKSTFDWII